MSKRNRKPGRVFETQPTQVSAEPVATSRTVVTTLRATDISSNDIDVPGPGQNGFHVDQDGALGVGGTDWLTSEFRVDASGNLRVSSPSTATLDNFTASTIIATTSLDVPSAGDGSGFHVDSDGDVGFGGQPNGGAAETTVNGTTGAITTSAEFLTTGDITLSGTDGRLRSATTGKRVEITNLDGGVKFFDPNSDINGRIVAGDSDNQLYIRAPYDTGQNLAEIYMTSGVSSNIELAASTITIPTHIAKSFLDAKGDLITATADDTPAILSVGANDTILMADSAQATGLKWVAPAAPVAVGTANSEGTSDDFSRASHVHAHEAAHINHDTTWAAKGDLIAGTANDTAQVLSVGTNGQMLTAQSGQTTGLQWATVFTHHSEAISGTLPASHAGVFRWYNRTGRTLTFDSVTAAVATAPSGGTVVVDVNVDGTTIMTGTKVVIADGTNVVEQTTFSTTTIADNSYITIDLDSTTAPAANLVVTVWLRG